MGTRGTTLNTPISYREAWWSGDFVLSFIKKRLNIQIVRVLDPHHNFAITPIEEN